MDKPLSKKDRLDAAIAHWSSSPSFMKSDEVVLSMTVEIEMLQEENVRLKTKIRFLRKQLERYESQHSKQYRYDQDYLPYEDYDRDR